MTLALPDPRAMLKPPPEKPEAEASLLGAALLDARIFEEEIRGHIVPADMCRSQHQLVLSAMTRLSDRGEAIGFLALQAELAAHDELDAIGGGQFLVGLMHGVPSVSHASTYAQIVERTATLRKLIAAANDIARIALTREDAAQAVAESQQILFALSENSLRRDIVSLELAVRRFNEQVQARGDAKIGIPTGFATFDEKTGGLQQSDLILLAGRPSAGKTSFALDIVDHVALVEGKAVAMFSLEMSEQQIVQRLLSRRTGIDGNRMRHGRLTQQEFVEISRVSADLQSAPVFIEESSRLTTMDILAKARRLQADKGLGLVVIDYLQLIESADDDENRVQEIAKISRALKATARELQVPVIALSQLSRQIETRAGEPMLSDLRDGGSLEQDADIVMFLWQTKEQHDTRDGRVRLKLAKHRNGPTAEIDLHFDAPLTRFTDMGEVAAAV